VGRGLSSPPGPPVSSPSAVRGVVCAWRYGGGMVPTELLYLTDAYVREFEARVVAVDEQPGLGIEEQIDRLLAVEVGEDRARRCWNSRSSAPG
jgi:hypothetical protein